LKNLGLLCFCLAIGLYAGKEFIDWFWWYYYGDEEEEENPAPVLCLSWKAWEWIDNLSFWLRSRLWWPIQRRLARIRYRFRPPELPNGPVDKDGRTPPEWLLIAIVGAWDLYKDEYDQNIKKNWDDYLKTRNENKEPEAQ